MAGSAWSTLSFQTGGIEQLSTLSERIRFFLPLLLFICLGCQKALPFYPLGGLGERDGLGENFQLLNHERKDFSSQNLHGKINLLYFGFTRCPSVCLHNLKRLQGAYKLLGFRKRSLQILMVTVDPEHDTPEVLKNYLAPYEIGAVGLWGPLEKIRPLSRKFGALFSPAKGEEHFIEHSAHIFLLDKKAHVRYLFNREDSSQKIANVVRRL